MPRLLVARPFHSQITTRCNIPLLRVLADVGPVGATWRTAPITACVLGWRTCVYPKHLSGVAKNQHVPFRSAPFRGGFFRVPACVSFRKATSFVSSCHACSWAWSFPRFDLTDMSDGGLCLTGAPACTPSPLRKAVENQHVPFRSDPDFHLTRARPRARERQRRNARKTSERIGTYNL